MTDLLGENGAPVRRSAGAEAARVMADLIAEGAQTLTFVRSRRGAELTALGAQARLERHRPASCSTRWRRTGPGYLAEDRSALETCAGRGPAARRWPPPTRSSWASTSPGWMPWCWPGFPGRSRRSGSRPADPGRRGQGALVVLIARDDPLDTYLVHHPDALLDKPVERVVIDPAQSLRSWAATALRGNRTAARRRRGAVAWRPWRWPRAWSTTGCCDVGAASTFRRRAGSRMRRWTSGVRPAARSSIVEADTGRLLGSTGVGQAPATVHPGAVYLHQGESYVVDSLDFEDGHRLRPRRGSRLRDVRPGAHRHCRDRTRASGRVFGPVTLGLVPVTVTHQVIGYLRRRVQR